MNLLPALEHAPHSGCLTCPPRPIRLRRFNPHPGFGMVELTCDGESIKTWFRYEDCKALPTFERISSADPDHDWRVRIEGPLSGVVYQRHGPGEWVAVERLMGFA